MSSCRPRSDSGVVLAGGSGCDDSGDGLDACPLLEWSAVRLGHPADEQSPAACRGGEALARVEAAVVTPLRGHRGDDARAARVDEAAGRLVEGAYPVVVGAVLHAHL